MLWRQPASTRDLGSQSQPSWRLRRISDTRWSLPSVRQRFIVEIAEIPLASRPRVGLGRTRTARRKTMTKTHRHTVAQTYGPYGYETCVATGNCHPNSHGGVRYRETCACGAYRQRNSTGFGREEIGPWIQESR